MYKEERKIAKVYFYSPKPNLVVNKEESIVRYDELLNKIGEFEFQMYTADIVFCRDYVHIMSVHGENRVYNYDGELLLHKKEEHYYHIFDLNNILKYDRESNYIFFNECKITSGKFTGYYINEKTLFFASNDSSNILISFNLESCKKNWIADLNSIRKQQDNKTNDVKCEVKKIFGTWENQLLVRGEGQLISLDVGSGEILSVWDELPSECQQFKYLKNNFPPLYSFNLDSQRGILYSMYGQAYFEINLTSKAVTCFDMTAIFKEMKIACFCSMHNPADEQYIYSTVQMDTRRIGTDTLTNAIIAFNRKTKGIDWLEIIWGEGLGTNSPKIYKDRLYQLGLGRTLFVYERGEISNDID